VPIHRQYIDESIKNVNDHMRKIRDLRAKSQLKIVLRLKEEEIYK